MFERLPAASFEEPDLARLGGLMTAELEAVPTPETEHDDEENTGIRAGYTYLGQFIDHDLTFDPVSSLDRQNDPKALEDFRTPRFDLDCLYGRGPKDQPYLYEDNGVRMLLGRELSGNPHDRKTRDLPRNSDQPARALIGDPRNDENVIVSQLQATMLRFHNRVVDLKTSATGKLPDFEEVQNVVRWHYQWVVLDDFLPTIAGQDVVNEILPHLKKETSIRDDKPNLAFFQWEKQPFMPIEFSAAVYRFGHSMVRPIYRLNTKRRRIDIFSRGKAMSLRGFREFPSNFAVDWSLFFNRIRDDQPNSGPERVQKSYKIDSSLVNPLGKLPLPQKIRSLAELNLIRGSKMGLPSGQSVARFMDLPVVSNAKLRVGKATAEKHSKNRRLTKISPKFKDNAPLWYYILAEAQQAFDGDDATPIRLGPVGGRIVAEVLIGLLLGDQYSFLSQDPSWKPVNEFTDDEGKFGMAELIKQAMNA